MGIVFATSGNECARGCAPREQGRRVFPIFKSVNLIYRLYTRVRAGSPGRDSKSVGGLQRLYTRMHTGRRLKGINTSVIIAPFIGYRPGPAVRSMIRHIDLRTASGIRD